MQQPSYDSKHATATKDKPNLLKKIYKQIILFSFLFFFISTDTTYDKSWQNYSS